YTAAQKPKQVAIITTLSTLLTVGLSIYFVVVRRGGVVGALGASLVANAIVAALTLIPTLRASSLRPSAVVLRRALAYSLPLVPHLIAGWGINLADRLILQPRVSFAELGLYSLGCQIASVVVLFGTAINSAATPMMLERLKANQEDEVPVLGTYSLLVVAFVTVATALLGGDGIRLLVPERFFGAEPYVPWVAFGGGCLGVYYVCSLGTWYSMKTTWLPVLTAIAAALNIGLNFALIPRYGAMAAAVNTFVAYLVLAASQTLLAQKMHRIAWPWRRWSKLLAATVLSFAAGWWLGKGELPRRLVVHGAATFVLFPALLWLGGFFLEGERAAFRRLLRR
ncbi:MAG: lipopolysaccharide biosynthesis protein, partial [Polyangia bacterium]